MLDVNFGARFFIDISIFLFFYFFGYCILFLLGFFGVGLGVFVCFVCVCFVCVFFFFVVVFFVVFLLNIRFLGGLPVRVDNSFLRRYKISICFGFFNFVSYSLFSVFLFYFIFTLYAICSGFTCDILRINWALREFHVLFLTWKNTHVNFSRKNILTWFTLN